MDTPWVKGAGLTLVRIIAGVPLVSTMLKAPLHVATAYLVTGPSFQRCILPRRPPR